MQKVRLRKKENKGITLIALVITIIVLLILAGVAIATLTGDNGILNQADNAKTQTEIGEEKELISLGYNEWKIAKTQDENANLKVEGAKNVTGNATDGWEIEFESGRKYYLSGEGEFGGSWTQEGDTITNGEGVTLKVGDYVDYDPTLEANANDLTYSSPSTKTGASSNQDFNATTYKNAGYGWRVLGVKNGNIRLISEEFVGAGTYSDSNRTYYTLKGKNGYINGIDELKTISAIFGHGKGAEGATSITVDDINAITGYNPKSPRYNQGSWGEYESEVTYTRGDGSALSSSAKLKSTETPLTWSGTQSTFNYYDKATKTFVPLTSGSTDITSTYYYYNACTLGTNNIVVGTNGDNAVDDLYNLNDTYKMLFGYNKIGTDKGFRDFTNGKLSQNYWLASDCADAGSNGVYWGLRDVYSGDIGYFRLYNSYGNEGSPSYGVRPVVSLKSDVSLEWNDTAKEWKIK